MLKKLIVSAVAVVLLLLVTAGVLVWRRPLAVWVWWQRRALARSGFNAVRVNTTVGTQTVWEMGKGPVLIFLHGAGDQAGTWAQVAPAFTAHFRVLIPDLPGHGGSAPPEGPLSVGTVLSGIESVIDQRAADRPVILVGNSLGAWIATLYAHQHPQRVSRLVLVNGGALQGWREDLTVVPANREQALRIFAAMTDPGTPRPPGFVLDDMVREARKGPVARLVATLPQMPQFLLTGRLQQIAVPVDLIWGESDQLFPMAYARQMATQFPAVRLTVLPRCGHVPQQECAVTFRKTLASLLEQLPPEPKAVAQGGATPAGGAR